MQQSDSVGLVVVSEEDQQPLLVHRISRDDIYQRQGRAVQVDSTKTRVEPAPLVSALEN
jgi:hypothetical protein